MMSIISRPNQWKLSILGLVVAINTLVSMIKTIMQQLILGQLDDWGLLRVILWYLLEDD